MTIIASLGAALAVVAGAALGMAGTVKLVDVTRSAVPASPTFSWLPARLRRVALGAFGTAELASGSAVVLFPGERAALLPAAALLAAAFTYLVVRRRVSPGSGCGCFGDLSRAPIDARAFGRVGMLLGGVIVALVLPFASPDPFVFAFGVIGGALTFALLSPEVGVVARSMHPAADCATEAIPLRRVLARLHASGAWKELRPRLRSIVHNDIWREGCWRFITFPADHGGRVATVVFAGRFDRRRSHFSAVIVDDATDEVIARFGSLPTGPVASATGEGQPA